MTLAVLVQMVQNVSPVTYPASRGELARTFATLGFNKGAEVGVWKGSYSHALCSANPGLALLCVDPWAPQPDYLEQKNNAAILQDAYEIAREILAPFNCTFARQPSVDVAAGVADYSLDFVYIDSNHRYQSVLDDITAWAPKVRPGGIVAGHDFFMKPKKAIEVEQAVRDYTAREGIHPWFVLRSKEDETPSWFWVVR